MIWLRHSYLIDCWTPSLSWLWWLARRASGWSSCKSTQYRHKNVIYYIFSSLYLKNPRHQSHSSIIILGQYWQRELYGICADPHRERHKQLGGVGLEHRPEQGWLVAHAWWRLPVSIGVVSKQVGVLRGAALLSLHRLRFPGEGGRKQSVQCAVCQDQGQGHADN